MREDMKIKMISFLKSHGYEYEDHGQSICLIYDIISPDTKGFRVDKYRVECNNMQELVVAMGY